MKKEKHYQRSPVNQTGDYELYHIRVLDGIRAVSVLIVAWYHIWQQSWLEPVFLDFSLDWLVRNGSILVDLLILLSGFCLFLPHARAMVYGDKLDTTGEFYIKRVARIAPSYYVSLLIVLFCFALPFGEYMGNTRLFVKDLLSHLTFTHNLFTEMFWSTHLNGVLWTVGVEVQLYLIFPILARWFRRWPLQTYSGMLAVGFCGIYYIRSGFNDMTQALYVNHTVTFIVVYANGMLGAWLYMLYTNWHKKRTWTEGIVATVAALSSIAAFRFMCDWRMNSGWEMKWQVDHRFLLSLVYLVFILGTIFAAKWFRCLWDNWLMEQFALISFNLYICHQYIAVKLKIFRIPYWEGQKMPNMTGNLTWQWKYTILSFVLSFAMAIAMTYLVEIPAARAIKNLYKKRREKNEEDC